MSYVKMFVKLNRDLTLSKSLCKVPTLSDNRSTSLSNLTLSLSILCKHLKKANSQEPQKIGKVVICYSVQDLPLSALRCYQTIHKRVHVSAFELFEKGDVSWLLSSYWQYNVLNFSRQRKQSSGNIKHILSICNCLLEVLTSDIF